MQNTKKMEKMDSIERKRVKSIRITITSHQHRVQFNEQNNRFINLSMKLCRKKHTTGK